MAEMLWILLLFQRPMSSEKKRETIAHVWHLSGEELSNENPYLLDGVLIGLGNPGVAYSTMRWREVGYLILLVRAFKDLTTEIREAVLSDFRTIMR